MNRACFPKEKHQNSQKWAKFMNFSFWPFLWFGLPGRLPNKLKKNPRDTGRVSLGHPAGQTGVYRPVSQGLPVIYYRKIDRKRAFLPGHRPGVPGTSGRPGGFRKFYVILSYVPFLLPINFHCWVRVLGGFGKAWGGCFLWRRLGPVWVPFLDGPVRVRGVCPAVALAFCGSGFWPVALVVGPKWESFSGCRAKMGIILLKIRPRIISRGFYSNPYSTFLN